MRVIIDTNVVIDALTSRKPWNECAEKIFIIAANRIVDIYILQQVVLQIFITLSENICIALNKQKK